MLFFLVLIGDADRRAIALLHQLGDDAVAESCLSIDRQQQISLPDTGCFCRTDRTVFCLNRAGSHNHDTVRGHFNAKRYTADCHVLLIRYPDGNIFDFDQDIYGQQITIAWYKYLRGEEKFADMAALSVQLKLDQVASENYFSSLIEQ